MASAAGDRVQPENKPSPRKQARLETFHFTREHVVKLSTSQSLNLTALLRNFHGSAADFATRCFTEISHRRSAVDLKTDDDYENAIESARYARLPPTLGAAVAKAYCQQFGEVNAHTLARTTRTVWDKLADECLHQVVVLRRAQQQSASAAAALARYTAPESPADDEAPADMAVWHGRPPLLDSHTKALQLDGGAAAAAVGNCSQASGADARQRPRDTPARALSVVVFVPAAAVEEHDAEDGDKGSQFEQLSLPERNTLLTPSAAAAAAAAEPRAPLPNRCPSQRL